MIRYSLLALAVLLSCFGAASALPATTFAPSAVSSAFVPSVTPSAIPSTIPSPSPFAVPSAAPSLSSYTHSLPSYSYSLPSSSAQPALPHAFAVNGRVCRFTAFASTPAQREAGLMNTTVTNSMFMLFSFGEPGNHPFWMKDTYSPLDIIWLRSNGTQATIVAVASVPPCVSYSADQGSCITYTPLEPADYVIETREGFVVRNRLAPGSQIMLLRWSADSRPIIGSARSSASC